jgi:hypothetical protein
LRSVFLGCFRAGRRKVREEDVLACQTRRAIACPIDPAPMTTITLAIADSFIAISRNV